IVLGKMTVSMALALLSMTVIILGTGLLLGATWGDPVAIAALVVSAAVAAVGISLLAVAFTRTEEQAGSAIAIVTLSLAVLGGSFFPANQGPELLSKLSLITPHAWFLRGVNDLSSGGDISTITSPLLVLLAIGLVTGGLGMLRARKMVMD
ncbi:MAG: ABC transporter permease, partial [Chloroflexota bacterium]|nr:ABC transporter permease [Chloroflexota bacterium]